MPHRYAGAMTISTDLRLGRSEWGLLGLLSLLWGGSFFFAKIAVAEIPPLTLVAGRVGIATMFLLLALQLCRVAMPRGWKLWLSFLAMGALNNVVPFGLLFWGQTRIDSGLASILNAFTPIFAVVAAHVLTADEKLDLRRGVAVLIGIAGVVLTIGPDALGDLGGNLAAEMACLAATLSYALAGIYGRRFRGLPPISVAAGQLCGATVLCVPLALALEAPWQIAVPSRIALGALLGLALISTAAAYVIYFRILARAGATNLLLVTFLIPICAILLGFLFLHEALALNQFLGMATIGGALVLIDGRLLPRGPALPPT